MTAIMECQPSQDDVFSIFDFPGWRCCSVSQRINGFGADIVVAQVLLTCDRRRSSVTRFQAFHLPWTVVWLNEAQRGGVCRVKRNDEGKVLEPSFWHRIRSRSTAASTW